MSASTTPSSSSFDLGTRKRDLAVPESKGKEEEKASLPLLLRLPPELIDHLLSLVPASSRQVTALSLTRVFPYHGISPSHLYTHLVIYRPEQLWPLWMKLKSDNGKNQMSIGIKSLSMKSWKGDADILNNILRCIPYSTSTMDHSNDDDNDGVGNANRGKSRLESKLNTLMLNIGTNFSPDHLEEMFENPRLNLERLELRFRPYVEQASYYQFLAGSYFDTAVETLTKKWPSIPSFTHLSIVQDLPPRSTVPPTALNSTSNSLAGSFADLSLATKAGGAGGGEKGETSNPSSDSDGQSGRSTPTPPTSISSVSDNPTDIGLSKVYTGHGPFGNPFLNEKLGITKPKTFAQPIVFFDIHCIGKFGASPVAENLTHLRLRVPSRDLIRVLITPPRASQLLFPSLKYLDISTTNVRIDTNLSTLLRSYSRLEHLVLDRVNLFGFTARDRGPELCHDLGGLLISAGLARGKERERQIGAWELEERTRHAEAEAAQRRAQRIAAEQESRENNDGPSAEVLAEIATRERIEEQQRQIELARSRRGHRSAAQATFSLRDRTRRTGVTTANGSSSSRLIFDIPPPDKLYLVLPALPNLRSIAIGGEASGVSTAKASEWEEQFHTGWREGLGRVLGWATHVAEKYERARRKADEWRAQESKSSTSSSNNGSSGSSKHVSKTKNKATTSSSSSMANIKSPTRPPLDVRLFRFPSSSEEITECYTSNEPGPHDLTAGLIEIDPSETIHREYLDTYKQAIGDAQLYADNASSSGGVDVKPPCVFCTVPDCEGPARRGAEGERVDGRGGMGGTHRPGCGHLIGRKIWGWEGFNE
ncbi:uncharacterized protein IL334_002760 [Kwoniella shivajii]|uniref:F-box domain-containing protein n=1 Tax=Kwoniella shivajii TaxID=564305 RepID=A0ABZ1CYP1_9TREE|nr:hypothetical protein IL334_002760 [Kwoniella shivajii]